MGAPPNSESDPLELLRRGLKDELPNGELAKRAEDPPMRVKLGLDPTASQVHLGWAVVLRKLRHFQEMGHTAVLVVGDYTAQIGDPSGKSSTRRRLTKSEVEAHAEECLRQVTPLLLPANLEIRYNSEWLDSIAFDEVLQLLSTTTVSQMLERDDFTKRFREGRPISLVEFVYPLLQAYDSVQLRADVELGGSDQLFNNLMGRAVQAAHGQRPQVVCTVPLLVGLDGTEKMSQSLGNVVAVDDPADDMFGKLMSIPDAAIVDYCRLAAWLPTAEVEAVADGLASGDLAPVKAKRSMAQSVVELYHGPGAGTEAEAAFDRVHVERRAPSDMDERAVAFLFPEGTHEVTLVDVIARLFDVSKSEARRLLAGGAIRLDSVRQSEDRELTIDDLRGAVVQRGKRHFVRLIDA